MLLHFKIKKNCYYIKKGKIKSTSSWCSCVYIKYVSKNIKINLDKYLSISQPIIEISDHKCCNVNEKSTDIGIEWNKKKVPTSTFRLKARYIIYIILLSLKEMIRTGS